MANKIKMNPTLSKAFSTFLDVLVKEAELSRGVSSSDTRTEFLTFCIAAITSIVGAMSVFSLDEVAKGLYNAADLLAEEENKPSAEQQGYKHGVGDKPQWEG